MSLITTDIKIGLVVLNAANEISFCLGLGQKAIIQEKIIEIYGNGVRSSDQAERGKLQTLKLMSKDGKHSNYVCIALIDHAVQAILIRKADANFELFDFIAAVPFSLPILNYFISSPHIALTVADHKGMLAYLSTSNETHWNLNRGDGIEQPAKDTIPNSRLAEVAKSGVAELAQLQILDGESRIVNRIPIRQNNKVVGAIGQVVFTEPKEFVQMREQLKEYEKTVAHLKKQIQPTINTMIGESSPIQRIKKEITTVSSLDVSVLILGDSGTGKELVAKAVHETTYPQKDRPLVSLNLAAIPVTLIEAELFGYEPGAFTGGKKEGQKGKFEEAEGGTLFLDEVGDIPLEIQLKLLRVLEERSIQKIGSNKTKKINFRLITATHRNMQELIDSGKFRLDLYYRISGVTLRLPALQQRLEDIPLLVPHFIKSFCTRNNLPTPSCSPLLYRYLAQRKWPGNIRQLKQKIEEALVFCNGKELLIEDFERDNMSNSYERSKEELSFYDRDLTTLSGYDGVTIKQPSKSIKQAEYQAVIKALELYHGHKTRAAQSLGISRSYLYKILARNAKN